MLAERLAGEVRAAGHDVWFDEWAVEPGDSILGRINEGLERCSYLILCCSPDGVASPWISREWLSALARQLDGHGIKVLPAVLSGGSPPAILADLKYADLATNWWTGVSDLLRAIR